MYACMLDTGNKEALIAFRGSESDTKENAVKDWGASDLGLFNSRLTTQQRAAEKYARDLFRIYGNTYTYSTTGHSLGGNLAEHVAVTIPEKMRSCFSCCVNLDGPGYSAAYILAHAREIEVMKGHIVHDKWSLVGALLHPLPGTVCRTVRAETPEKKGSLRSLGWRHDTNNVVFDRDGNLMEGSRDRLAGGVEIPVRLLDTSAFLMVPSRWKYLAAENLVTEAENARERGFLEKNGAYDPGAAAGIGVLGDYEAEPDGVDGAMGALEETATEIYRLTRRLEDGMRGVAYMDAASGKIYREMHICCSELYAALRQTVTYVEAGRRAMREIRDTEEAVKEILSE
jgi:hypothetical protein